MASEQQQKLTEGILEILPKGFGFLRKIENGFQPESDDVHVPTKLINRHQLREGSQIAGFVQQGSGGRRSPLLMTVKSADGADLETYRRHPKFASLTSVSPYERLRIDETNDPTLRVIDLIAPIGKGQRGLIVAPPRTGKTVLLQKLANAIETAHPEVHLIVALIDERPEEITEMQRNTKAEVIHSSSDMPGSRHTKVCDMILQRSRRLLEAGQDVVILLDSITRMARAYNAENKGSGRTLSGGLGANSMAKPREFFGAARKAEEGGSLTILATALIDTGSRMDDVIFEEFKGTGNMELVLSRKLADRRIWPAIDISASGTRREELLRDAATQNKVNLLRRALSRMGEDRSMEALLEKIGKTSSNASFIEAITAS